MRLRIEEPEIQKALRGMAARVARDHALARDLFQEAQLHFWLMEQRRPGQTLSWYLQSANFHLLHYVRSGRSVDSYKRQGDGVEFTSVDPDSGDVIEREDAMEAADVVGEVCARDLLELLSQRVDGEEREVLNCLVEGLGVREAGRKLKMTHTMARKHRRRIAVLARKLMGFAGGAVEQRSGQGHRNGRNARGVAAGSDGGDERRARFDFEMVA